MLYLLRSYTKSGSILKVGYTCDLDHRLYQYKSHNPGIELINTRDGELLDEYKLHLYLHLVLGTSGDSEWYPDCELVTDGFYISVEELDKFLWKSRGQFLDVSIFKQINSNN